MFNVGDLVICHTKNTYVITNENTICKVIRNISSYVMDVVVVASMDWQAQLHVGHVLSVQSEHFKRYNKMDRFKESIKRVEKRHLLNKQRKIVCGK